MKLHITQTAGEAGQYIASMLCDCLLQKPDALLGLATGGTVLDTYQVLCEKAASGSVSFAQAHTVNLDEYLGLPTGHSQSMACFMQKNLLDKVMVPTGNRHFYDCGGEPQLELRRYQQFLQRQAISFLLLGIGTNGHIGFNEPEDFFDCAPHIVSLAPETIAANARFFENPEQVPRRAMTIGMRDTLRAERIVVAAFGVAKAAPIAALFADDCVTPQLPVSIVKLAKDATVVVDQALADAAGLSKEMCE